MKPLRIKDSVVWQRTKRGWVASITVTHTPRIALIGAKLPEDQRVAAERLLLAVAKSMDQACAEVGAEYEKSVTESQERLKKGTP